MTSQFPDMRSSSNFFEVVLFLLSSLVIGLSFMSISLLVPKLCKFIFIRDCPGIRKSEIFPSEFCQISWEWGKLEIPNLARILLTKCYWMLQNARATAFNISELLLLCYYLCVSIKVSFAADNIFVQIFSFRWIWWRKWLLHSVFVIFSYFFRIFV